MLPSLCAIVADSTALRFIGIMESVLVSLFSNDVYFVCMRDAYRSFRLVLKPKLMTAQTESDKLGRIYKFKFLCLVISRIKVYANIWASTSSQKNLNIRWKWSKNTFYSVIFVKKTSTTSVQLFSERVVSCATKFGEKNHIKPKWNISIPMSGVLTFISNILHLK